MKKLLFLLSLSMTFIACNNDVKSKELKVLDNSNSSELTFILELNTKNNSRVDVEEFTQYLSNFIVEREPSSVYGYFISKNLLKFGPLMKSIPCWMPSSLLLYLSIKVTFLPFSEMK